MRAFPAGFPPTPRRSLANERTNERLRSLPAWLACLLLLCCAAGARAANLTPVAVTGYNLDLVVENTASGPPFTAYAVEFSPGEGNVYYQHGLPAYTNGFPATGLFTSALGDGTTFQLQPATAKNALVLSSATGLSTGKLTLVTPGIYNRIAVIANSANGNASGQGVLTLNFSDGSSVATSYFAPDWFNNVTNVALGGMDRIAVTSGALTIAGVNNPRLYQTTVSIPTLLNGTNKPLASLSFGRPTVANATAIFAVSGELAALSPPVAAAITTPPSSQAVGELSAVSFSAAVNGNPYPTLQWYRNGAALPGATNLTYSLTAALTNNGDAYFLIAANSFSNLTYRATSAVATLTVYAVAKPISVTGFNADVVVENTAGGPPYNAYAVEVNPNEGNAYYQSGLPGTSLGLPVNGAFSSAVDGTRFQLQPYTTNNALIMSSDTGITTGTLTLATPGVYNTLAILANSASGGGLANLTLQFSDGTSYLTNYYAPDWFGNTGYALLGFERIPLAGGGTQGAPADPRFYQTTLNLSALFGATNKTLTSLSFGQASAGATAVYAVSGILAPPSPPLILTSPANVTVTELAPATFTAAAAGNPYPTLQWYRNGTPVTGATNAAYTLAVAPLSANGNFFQVVAANVVSNVTRSVTSAVATLSVVADHSAPALLAAQSLGLTQVQVQFSKRMSAATVATLANFQLAGTNGAVPLAAAALDTTQSNVVLFVTGLLDGAAYTLTVNNLADQTVAGNVIPPNSTAAFVASAFVPVAVGGGLPGGGQIRLPGFLNVTGGGGDIGGTADEFQFGYELLAGDFDLCVRLAGVGLSDVWAKAGLMARESLAPGARFAAALATPVMNGAFLEYRATTNGLAVTAGTFPDNYPNTWLRLKRLGGVFTAYAGYDGWNWTVLGATNLSMGGQIYVGLAVSSHNPAALTSAQFLPLAAVTTNNVVATPVNPHEPLGPCARTTPIAVSEIMYQPAPRTDAYNLEYLELYNSNPWLQDISGYQLAGGSISYTFPPGTIMAGGSFLVVAAAPGDLQSVYGLANVLGPYHGSLKKSGTVQLNDEHGHVLLVIPFSNVFPWPVAADGTGHSLVLGNPTYGEGDPRAWDISDVVGGSPGQAEAFRPGPRRNVVLNEILAHSENPAVPEFVELYNHGAAAVDLSGCILTDDPATNKSVLPAATVIPAGGFLTVPAAQLNFALNPAGGTVYFFQPDQQRVLDALQYEAQADGLSFGRWPDGANDFYFLGARTPGTNNSAIRIADVAINELMYDPITGNAADQYLELYNQGTNVLNLGAWRMTAGVSFTFPSNTTLPPGGYLVVASDLANLWSKYPNLNATNSVGNWGGKLSHNGERVALAMPQSAYGTNTIYVVQDEVTYGVGGRWGAWSAGGGSSLELIDPHANHRLAANWADSDETHKSTWVTVKNTGVLDNGANYDPAIDYAQIGLLDSGECLVDNLVVADANGVNYVTNPDFEAGVANWAFQGCFVRSSWENSGCNSAHSLHLRCSDRMWTAVNSCQVALNPNSLAAGQTATLQFQARWLRGWNEVLLRMNGNWLEATAALPIPANLGTPGMPNSAYATNAGPAFYQVTHSPTVPAASQAVVVTARVHDPDGFQSLTLNYRIDPATNYTAVTMKDDGTGGDALAGDGLFSATLPGQAANTIAAFYLSGVDRRGAVSRFPALLNDNSPVREGVVMFGDGNPAGSFGTYHLWITQTNATRWTALSDLSNEAHDGTFVNGGRVIYNMQARFAGSPFHQIFDTPYGNLCHYKWIFQDDDKFLGATDFNKIHQPGNSPGDDPSLQREQTSYTFMRALGVPWLSRRYVAVYVNGNRRGNLMEDSQVPTSDMVKEYFPNDTTGYLYKMQPWFEAAPFPSGNAIGVNPASFCYLLPYTTTGGAKKPARYRYNFLIRRTADSASNFTNVFSLVDAANSAGTPNYVANMENIADMENWMRVFAGNHAAGNLDSVGSLVAQNIYGYIGTQGTRYSLMMWDLNIDLGASSSWGPGQNLFTTSPGDPNVAAIFVNPTFRRMYWRALQELVNGPLAPGGSDAVVLGKYNAFVANGLAVENPRNALLPWLVQAGVSIAAQLAVEDTAFFTVNPAVVGNNTALLTGTAPVVVQNVTINGALWPLTWTTTTNWQVSVPLLAGTNFLTAVGLNRFGQPVAGASNQVVAIYNGPPVNPAGLVVINEILAAPGVANAGFVELFNQSPTNAVDLSGWQLSGLDYTFPAGSLLGANSYLVLAANRAAFAAAYGATNLVFDTFPGHLAPEGGTLALVPPGVNAAPVAQVRFAPGLPWPTNVLANGNSLQLVDARQDNWRPLNWRAAPATPGQPNGVAKALPAFPSLWLNEVLPDNRTSLTNRAGGRGPWVEIFNPSTNAVSLNGLYLTGVYSNLTQWAFPTGMVAAPGQFLVVFADGLTNLTGPGELHTGFALPPATGSLALARVDGGVPGALDYLDYANLPINFSYGSEPDGQSFVREVFFTATPGATNSTAVATGSFIPYTTAGAVYSQNFDGLPNPGTTSVNTANPVTIDGVTYALANPFDFAGAVGAGGGLGGAGLPALAGWYGLANPGASAGTRFGATAGDQTTGGLLSFGPPANPNRALGLLATTSTGYTSFGLKLVNETGLNLGYLTLDFVGELWRQSSVAKTLQFHYWIDYTATNGFTTNATQLLPALDVAFPVNAGAVGGVPVDGTTAANQAKIGVVNQPILLWPPGAALWLAWEMTDPAGKGQGLGIDNLNFAATAQPQAVTGPALSSLPLGVAGGGLVLTWPTILARTYQMQYTTNLAQPNWSAVGRPQVGTGGPLGFTNTALPAGFYRLQVIR